MYTKAMNWLLMAAVVLGLGMSVTSCKDDDDDKSENRNADASPMDSADAQVAWRWLCAMTNAQTMSDDWAKKTYQPTIGVASENNKLNRLVVVADIDEARMNFANMADIEVNKLATAQTFDVKGVGRLTWTPSAANAQNLAEVTVDTKLIPGLQKIIYCTQEQRGENGMFYDNIKGAAWYRFGDVVRDSKGYYWVCVRPAHEVDDKGDSHWINIFNSETGNDLPDANIYSKYNKKYNNKVILFPTKLTYKREHIYNFVNLIYAILDPQKYHSVVGSFGKGLGQFPYERHNETFLKNVGRYWNKTWSEAGNKTIWKLLFNKEESEIKNLTTLNFYYQGYSWLIGDNATLWRYSQNGYQMYISGSESGDKISWPAKEKGFDITRCTFKIPTADTNSGHAQTENGNGYWVIRYAKGEDLVSGGTYTPVSGFPGCEDIYRYYKEKDVKPGSTWDIAQKADQEIQSHQYQDARVGDILNVKSQLFDNEEDASKEGTPIGIVCYRQSIGGAAIDKSTTRTVLLFSLYGSKGDNAKMAWGEANGNCATRTDIEVGTTQPMDGIECTKKLATDSHSHPAAKFCYNFWDENLALDQDGKPDLITYILPSTGQWQLALKGITGKDFKNLVDGADLIKAINDLYQKSGVTSSTYSYLTKDFENTNTISFWTSTEASETEAYVLTINKNTGVVFEKKPKSEKHRVLPFIIYG